MHNDDKGFLFSRKLEVGIAIAGVVVSQIPNKSSQRVFETVITGVGLLTLAVVISHTYDLVKQERSLLAKAGSNNE